jgi:hypothetical protein
MFSVGQTVEVRITPKGWSDFDYQITQVKAEKGFVRECSEKTGLYLIEFSQLRMSNWYREEEIQAVEIPDDLTKMSLEELTKLKDRWIEEAVVGKKFDKLRLIADRMGKDEQTDTGYPFKEVVVDAEHSLQIRLRYYFSTNGEVNVCLGEKLVALYGDEIYYIPGYWEQYLFSLYEMAVEKESEANEAAAEQQRLELIKELTLPALVVAQAG